MKRAAVLLFCCTCVVGCNRSAPPETTKRFTPAPPAPAVAPEKVPDLQSEPLTQPDVDLYLSVMKEAVDKRQHLSDADKKVLADEAAWYKHLKSGYHPPLTPAEQALLVRATELHNLDNDIARSRGHYELYTAIKSAVEGMVGPMKCDHSDCGIEEPDNDPKIRAQQIADEKKRKAVIAQDLVLLKPHATEITAMVKQLRP
jgi:hypothetical protein